MIKKIINFQHSKNDKKRLKKEHFFIFLEKIVQNESFVAINIYKL